MDRLNKLQAALDFGEVECHCIAVERLTRIIESYATIEGHQDTRKRERHTVRDVAQLGTLALCSTATCLGNPQKRMLHRPLPLRLSDAS